jgi:UvrD-like helicase C-terminal domain
MTRTSASHVPRLGKNPVTGIDDEVDSLVGYRSPMHGGSPVIRHADTRDEESGYAVNERLKVAGVKAVGLAASSRRDAIRVGTMHGMKGLEFQAVAVIGVAEGAVPTAAIPARSSVEADRVAVGRRGRDTVAMRGYRHGSKAVISAHRLSASVGWLWQPAGDRRLVATAIRGRTRIP